MHHLLRPTDASLNVRIASTNKVSELAVRNGGRRTKFA
jgi:hypothetical protein